MASAALPAAPRAPRLLRTALLLLLLLVAASRRAAGECRALHPGPGRLWAGARVPHSPAHRVSAPRRGTRAHRAALPVSADRAGHSPQEHPEPEGDVAGPTLRPDRSHSHAQVRAGSLSQPRRPHGEETPAEDAQQGQQQLTQAEGRS